MTFVEWNRDYNHDGLNASGAWNAAIKEALRILKEESDYFAAYNESNSSATCDLMIEKINLLTYSP